EFLFRELGALVPAGSGLAFSQVGGNLRISLAILSSKIEINAVNNPYFSNRIGLSQESGMYEAIVADTFTFKGPNGLLMDIPPGSVATLSEKLEIISIRVPVKETPFKRKQLGL